MRFLKLKLAMIKNGSQKRFVSKCTDRAKPINTPAKSQNRLGHLFNESKDKGIAKATMPNTIANMSILPALDQYKLIGSVRIKHEIAIKAKLSRIFLDFNLYVIYKNRKRERRWEKIFKKRKVKGEIPNNLSKKYCMI